MENKTLVFDMDGTLADFYGIPTWLEDLHTNNVRPYRDARPLYNMNELNEIVNEFKRIGYRIIIVSWLANNATKEFCDEIRKAKKTWLEKYGFIYDEIHLVKYGTTKANCVRKYGKNQILIDDSAQVRKGWTIGTTIDATKNILTELKKMLDNLNVIAYN